MGKHIQCSDEVSLANIIGEIAPRSILALGPQVEPAVTQYLAAHPAVCLTHIAAGHWIETIDAESRCDFILLSQILEQMCKSPSTHFIARLRERCQGFYVKVPLGKAWLNQASFWEPNDLRSLGLDLVSLTAERGRPMGLFRYDAKAYKTDAQWLNSKYWAQPD